VLKTFKSKVTWFTRWRFSSSVQMLLLGFLMGTYLVENSRYIL
jgi:hypothetical protein